MYNTLGFGHREIVYHRALEREIMEKELRYEREKSLSVIYKNKKIGEYRPDFLIDGKIIVEVKAVKFISPAFEKQLTYYLKATSIQLGYLVNFGSTEIKIVRRIWTKQYLR